MDSYKLGQDRMHGLVIGGGDWWTEGSDWRTGMQQDSRERIVSKIYETLERHLPYSGQEELQEIKNIAVRFEGKMYTKATSQSHYLRMISLKMLTMEKNSKKCLANSLQSNAASTSENPHNPAYRGMQSQIQNQVQQLPIAVLSDQSQVRQQILFQNNAPSVEVPNSSDSSSEMGSATSWEWQEEIHQKIKLMHEMYYAELHELYWRMAANLQQHENKQLKFLKLMLERLIIFLRTNKNDIQPKHKDMIVGVEKQIVNIIDKPVSSLQQQTQMPSNEGRIQ